MTLPDQIHCVALGRGEVGSWPMLADRLRSRWEGARAALASVDRAGRLVSGLLERHARGARPAGCRPFGTPLALALRAFGSALDIDMPLSALQMRTHDWVRCGRGTHHLGQYFLTEANWASLVKPLRPSAVMREADYLRASRLAYRDTLIYTRYLEMMEQGYAITRNRAAVNSREKLDEYFDRFVALYRSIEQNGLLRMRDVRGRDALPGSTAPGRGDGHAQNMDIGVAIGPEGAIAVLPGAQHRLAIAGVLRLETVPVQVRMIHGQWLRGLAGHGACSVQTVASGLALLSKGAGRAA